MLTISIQLTDIDKLINTKNQ